MDTHRQINFWTDVTTTIKSNYNIHTIVTIITYIIIPFMSVIQFKLDTSNVYYNLNIYIPRTFSVLY
jgi:hypothetical protein